MDSFSIGTDWTFQNHAINVIGGDLEFQPLRQGGISNPPYGVDWKKDKDAVENEASRGYAGRFGAGTPRISDGQLLFLQHLISKMKNVSDGGSRIGIVHNGSPLFTGDAGSGESEIRRWIIEKDLLETIIALPDQLFYNTGINTYLWFVTNRKSKERKGKIQLIDARGFYKKMRKSLGNKRHEIDREHQKKILELYNSFEENEFSKIFNNTEFAYRQIQVEQPLKLSFNFTPEKIESVKLALEEDKKNKEFLPLLIALKGEKFNDREKFLEVLDKKAKELKLGKLSTAFIKKFTNLAGERDENAKICYDSDGKPEADPELRDFENVPYDMEVNEYFKKEVLPYVPDAWINESVKDHKDGKIGKVGYEIPFTRHFYKYEAPRDLEVIEADIEEVENELLTLLKQL
jgi:type I restriction enzyme M protein